MKTFVDDDVCVELVVAVVADELGDEVLCILPYSKPDDGAAVVVDCICPYPEEVGDSCSKINFLY